MGRPVKAVSGWSSSQIKELLHSKSDYKVGYRLMYVYLSSLGESSLEIGDKFKLSFRQVRGWVKRFEQEGIEGLKDRKGRGRKSRMSDEQKQELKRVVLEVSPSEYEYNTETWNGVLLLDWIEKKWNLSYKKSQIYNILKELGLSYKKSKGYYPEADKEKQEEFKEAIKKTKD